MDIDKLSAFLTILLILSLATERLVEIVKGVGKWWKTDFLKPPAVNEIGVADEKEAAVYKAKNHVLAIICGVFTAWLASPMLNGIFSKLFPSGSSCKLYGIFDIGKTGDCFFDLSANGLLLIFTLGLLASAGSGFWNSILEYILKLKELKKIEVNNAAMARMEKTADFRNKENNADSVVSADNE